MAFANLIMCVGIFLPTVGFIAMLFPEPVAESMRSWGIHAHFGDSVDAVRTSMRKLAVVAFVAGALLLGLGWFLGVGSTAPVFG